jgi:hypothetical protein
MKKFSKIAKVKVAKEPKPVVKDKTNLESFSEKVQFLMDQFLTIQTYGPIDRYQRAGNIKIKGKDLFLESLIKLIESNKGKDSISILESLKEQSKDWKSIDNKIDSIKENKFDIVKESDFIKYKEGVSKFLSKYSTDDELCLLAVKENVSIMKNKEVITNKYLACKSLKEENKFTSVIDNVIEIYESKISKL